RQRRECHDHACFHSISPLSSSLLNWENSTAKAAQCAPYFQAQTKHLRKIYRANARGAQDSSGANKEGAHKLWHTGHNGDRNHFNIYVTNQQSELDCTL